MTTSSGAITVRDQYDTFDRWKGNQRGSSMISTGISGTARHGTCPKRARAMRVKTLLRSEEHTSELQSLMRISYAVFCLKKKNTNQTRYNITTSNTPETKNTHNI